MTDVDSKEMTKYEIMVILNPDLTEKKTEEELNQIREFITSNGGEIFHEDIWGLREFAYRIKKNDQGYYAVLNFTLPPEMINEMNQNLNIEQNVLRFLITKTPKDYQIVTLAEYAAEAEKREEEKAKEKPAKKEPAKPKKVTKTRPKKEEEKAEKPAPEAKKEAKKEEKPKPKAKKEPEMTEDVDAKLSSIIDDPDITL